MAIEASNSYIFASAFSDPNEITIHLQHSDAYCEGAMPQKMWTLQNKCQLFISDDLDPVHFVLKVVSRLQVQKIMCTLYIY